MFGVRKALCEKRRGAPNRGITCSKSEEDACRLDFASWQEHLPDEVEKRLGGLNKIPPICTSGTVIR